MSSYYDLDQNALDKEWLEQPALYHKAAEDLANSRVKYERAKVERDLIEVELGKAIRSNPSDFGLEKTTENAITEAIKTHAKYQAACQLLIDRMEERELREVEVSTLNQRKTALENLVQLFLASYFATPKITGSNGEKMKSIERDQGFTKKSKVGIT